MQGSTIKKSDLFQLLKQPLNQEHLIKAINEDFQKRKVQVNDALYIYSQSYSALCSFYIAAFMTQKIQDNQRIKQKIEKMFKQEQSKEQSDIFFKKFKLDLQENTDLIQTILRKQNSMNTNRLLFEKACSSLDEGECTEMVRSMANQITISTYEFLEKLELRMRNKNSKYAIVLGKYEKRPFLFIFQISPINSQIQSPSKSALKSQKPVKQIRISTSSQEEQKYNNNKDKDQSKDKKGKSIKSKVESNNTQVKQQNQMKVSENAELKQSNQFTWFQGFILIIIVLAVLSHFFGIFDEQILNYNQKKGNYYLIQTGYAITSCISKGFQSLFP